MKRMLNFSIRNFKEIVRDPLSIIFSLLLPLLLLFIFQQINIPSPSYSIEIFTPGIVVFSLSFITMFTASLVAKDRHTAFLTRLAISPMTTFDYIGGYAFSVLPLVIVQNILFYLLAVIYGLTISVSIMLAILITIPLSLFFIFMGILIGSFTNEKSSSGVSSIIVQLVAFTSGMYFDASMIGEEFNVVCQILPFSHFLTILKSVLNHSTNNVLLSVVNISVFLLASMIVTLLIFKYKKFHN